MLLSDFNYTCPADCIAQYPRKPRRASRLLRINKKSDVLQDTLMTQLPELLNHNDLLIFNNTQVIAARLTGRKSTGGKVEILLERLLDEKRALVQIRASKSPHPGCQIELKNGKQIEVLQRQGDLFIINAHTSLQRIFSEIGEVPLPPYIQRAAIVEDQDNYQTVFAKHPGAVAAPTAGLHFDDILLKAIADRGIHWAYVTLHVGLGTFQPVRVEKIEQHRMHSERMWMPSETQESINKCRQAGGRIIAVGTTSVRCLESMPNKTNDSIEMETDIFIFPGYRFNTVDAMITNFHLPKSTLLMLVCAFAGTQKIMAAYQHAIKNGYRFYSYGDAMLIE